jgi:hypothetical protein
MSNLYQPSSRYVLPVYEERTSYGFKRQDPYNKLFEERIIFLGTQIDDVSANDVMAQLLTLESDDPDRDISIYINSPGPTSRPPAWVRRRRPRRSSWRPARPASGSRCRTPGSSSTSPRPRVVARPRTSRSRPAR